jgi:hypothetical protein
MKRGIVITPVSWGTCLSHVRRTVARHFDIDLRGLGGRI